MAATLSAVFLCTTAQAQVRARAEVACKPTGTPLEYDCTVALKNSRTKEPLSGVTVSVGADMPSMPGAHSIRPVAAEKGTEAGTYRARIVLEMHGDWALRLDLSGPLRDRVFKTLRFEPDRVTEAGPRSAPHRMGH
jgi:hypothetical protein